VLVSVVHYFSSLELFEIGISAAMHTIDITMMNELFGDAMESTPTVWKELLNETGFDIVDIHPTRSLAHFVEAVPRSDE
jgi:hypothetical protein